MRCRKYIATPGRGHRVGYRDKEEVSEKVRLMKMAIEIVIYFVGERIVGMRIQATRGGYIHNKTKRQTYTQ